MFRAKRSRVFQQSKFLSGTMAKLNPSIIANNYLVTANPSPIIRIKSCHSTRIQSSSRLCWPFLGAAPHQTCPLCLRMRFRHADRGYSRFGLRLMPSTPVPPMSTLRTSTLPQPMVILFSCVGTPRKLSKEPTVLPLFTPTVEE